MPTRQSFGPAAAALAIAGSALPRADAQNARVSCEVYDHAAQAWVPDLVARTGETLTVRVRVRYVGEFPSTIQGFAGMTCQPTLSEWYPEGGDRANPWPLIYPVPGCLWCGTDCPSCIDCIGRVFWQPGQGIGITIEIVPFSDPGHRLRFAGSKNTTPTTNLAWGVPTGQPPLSLLGNRYCDSLDVIIIQYRVTLGRASPRRREMVATVPAEWIGVGRANWYINAGGNPALQTPITSDWVIPATIRVRPLCDADFDDGSGRGVIDDTVGVPDLLFFLERFHEGSAIADIDDGVSTGTPDGGVDVSDLLYFLARYETGC